MLFRSWATAAARCLVSACSLTGGGVLRVFVVARATSGGQGSADPLASFFPGYGVWWWRCGDAAVEEGGVQAVDLGRWPRIWSGRCSGQVPGRWSCFSFRSSSSELVAAAALQGLRTWCSSVLGARSPDGRRWSFVLVLREVEDGVTLQCRLYPLFFFACNCCCIVF